MRVARLLLSSGLCVLLVIPSVAQQTTSSITQATQLLHQSLAALQGNTSLTDVTLSGTARRIAGSDDESGTGVLKAIASGAGRMDLSLSAGPRSEIQNLTADTPAGSWSGPDAVSHAIAYHNLLTEPAWFFPAFAIARRLSNSNYIATYIGHETHNGQAVEHVSVSQIFSSRSASSALLFKHLSQVDFFLDSTTLLPSAIAFTLHPDDNASYDIPIEVRFSDYRADSGGQVPFHVQEFLNNTLLLDFQAQTVTFNTSLSASTFQVQ
jgi:hypothetical protein